VLALTFAAFATSERVAFLGRPRMVMANLLNLDWRESNEVLFAEKAALANGSAVTKC
jgi:hypothetical protein